MYWTLQLVALVGLGEHVVPDAVALGHGLGLDAHGAALLAVLLDLEDLAVGRLDLRGEVERDGDFFAEALILDRDRVQVVLAGLGGVADAQTGGRDRGAEVGDLAAVLAAG
jgi:hypothetical protein